MRKMLSLLLFVAFAGVATAQTASFSLVTQPCNNNGILKAYFANLTPPLTVTWTTEGSTAQPIVHNGVTNLFDILTSYSGGPITVMARDTFGATDIGHFAGAPPFTYHLHIMPGICPAYDTVMDSVFNATAPVTTQWYNLATQAVVATGTTAILPDGNYGVIITDGAGCTYGSRVDPLYAPLQATTSYTLSATSTTAACTNGTATIDTLGSGIPSPIGFQWSNGATTPGISNLVTGTYNVMVTDGQGCRSNTSVFVPQSIAIVVPVVPTAATCLDTNGAVIAFGSGGTSPYTYLWNNGVTTQSQSSIVAGTYTVNVTDANGCIGSGSGVVGTSSPVFATYTASPSLCTSPTGNATLTVTGGTLPYNIAWYTTGPQVGVTATHLAAGNYYFRVTDALGCLRDGYVTVPPIDVISLTYSSVAALCSLSNGSITVIPTGGVAPYSYAWSTGATGATLGNVPTGDYTLTVTDNLGCSVTTHPYLDHYSPVHTGAQSVPATCVFAHDGMNISVPYGGTPPYTYAWSTGGNTSVINSLPSGPYWVRVTDATGCTSDYDYSFVGYDTSGTNCYCTIQGTVYKDMNGNCIQDPGEGGIPNIQIHISGMGYTYTDANGFYSYKVPSGSYTVSETVLAYYPLGLCQNNNQPVIISTGTAACTHFVNFANIVDTIHDMHISTWDYSSHYAVPGTVYRQATIITNDGTVPEPAIASGYTSDGQFFPPAFTPSAIYTGGPYNYDVVGIFPTLAAGTSQTFFMDYHVPTNIPLGTSVVFKDTVAYDTLVSQWQNDYSPWNNVNQLTTTTASSFDPNFKEVSPKGTGTAGVITTADSILEYMVHFQNTGGAPAENVVVIDTLDDNLNWLTLKPTYSSAPCKVDMQQVGIRKIVTFTFHNINLPTQASDPRWSNGMFTYTIHTMPGRAVGSTFRNHASIYFDYNAPVMTNTTLNTLGSLPGSVTNVSADNYSSFTIYPNPARQSFNAIINSDLAGDASMSVTDVTGKTLMNRTVNLQKGTQTITTDASSLAPGIYFVTFNNQGKTQTQKLVIMK